MRKTELTVTRYQVPGGFYVDVIPQGGEVSFWLGHKDCDIQEKMFEVLGFSPERAQEQFGFLLEAFKYGVPPHAGLAYGLDRLCMLMAGAESIRDVIAFPKVQNASEPMTNCPDFVDDKQLDELSLAVTRKEETSEEE